MREEAHHEKTTGENPPKQNQKTQKLHDGESAAFLPVRPIALVAVMR
jgi:hypothetical protein